MLYKFVYFLYSDDKNFKLLSKHEKSLFVKKVIVKNKFAFKVCFIISLFFVILSFYLNGV